MSRSRDSATELLPPAGDRALSIHDRTGKPLRTVQMSPQDEEMLVRLAGDDVWTASTHGVIRRYHEDALIASQPTHTTEIEDLRIAGDHILSVGFDATIVVQRADARQLVLERGPCEAGSYAISGPAIGYVCEDGRELVYVGRRRVGEIRDRSLSWVTLEPGSKRAAVVGKDLTVFDGDGAVLATAGEDHRGPVAFEDADHLLVVRQDLPAGTRHSLWRLTIPTGAWTRITTVPAQTGAIAVGRGGVMLGTERHAVLLRAGREVGRVDLGEGVDLLTASADRRWISAHLATGATVILDATTGALARRFEPVEAFGVAAMLDATGDLVLRTSRGTLTVWERATGDNLLGLIDIPRETRPVAEILRAIECRVPLRVTGSRLESAPTNCGSR